MHGGGGLFGAGFGGGFGGGSRRFEEQYHCYSVAYADKSQLEVSNKVRRHASLLDKVIFSPVLLCSGSCHCRKETKFFCLPLHSIL